MLSFLTGLLTFMVPQLADFVLSSPRADHDDAVLKNDVRSYVQDYVKRKEQRTLPRLSVMGTRNANGSIAWHVGKDFNEL